jgi:16S rRNA processing protein RimM
MGEPPPVERLLDVGRVVRPHGIRGHVVVELWTNRAERMEPGAVLRSGDRHLEVRAASKLPTSGRHERWVVDFEGCATREGAEAIRGATLQAAPIDVAGAMWVHELVGSTVADPAGNVLGVVTAVEANPASDLLVLDGDRLIPLTFVTAEGPGRLRADLPPGLLEP